MKAPTASTRRRASAAEIVARRSDWMYIQKVNKSEAAWESRPVTIEASRSRTPAASCSSVTSSTDMRESISRPVCFAMPAPSSFSRTDATDSSLPTVSPASSGPSGPKLTSRIRS